MNKNFGVLFAILWGVLYSATFAQLPQNHPYQKILQKYMGTLQKKDFDVPLSRLTVKPSYFNSVDDVYKLWLFMGYQQADMMDTRGLRTDASNFTLGSIKAGGRVNMTVGKKQFIDAIATSFYAAWDYPGNPHYGSRALKLRAFVAVAVDMMMQDQEHERGKNNRSDFLGMQLIRWAYAYGVAKDVLPSNVRDAFEKGLIKMVGRLEEWGPNGTHADIDMASMVGLLYAAKFVDSQNLTERAHRYIDRLLEEHFSNAGYIDHGGAYDPGYNGISSFFINWAAQFSDYPPLIETLQKMSTLKAYMTLPDPDGNRFSPFHSNPSSGSDAPHDLWDPYYRDVGIASYSEDATYLAFNGGHETMDSKSSMLARINKSLFYFLDDSKKSRGAFATPSNAKPGRWKHNHWVETNSLNATALYYKDGLYDRLRSLKNTELTEPPFARSEDFTESLADKFLSVKRPTYGTIIFNDRLSWWTNKGQTKELNGFGGGNISAFWTPETGSVLLGGSRGTHDTGLDLNEWREWPVHALSGETTNGRAFSSGLQRYPEASYELDRTPGKVSITGDLADIYSDPQNGLQGKANYKREFQVKENGLQVTTSVQADGSNRVKELYEILPVYRRNAYRQKRATPTTIEFKVNGRWQQADTNLREISSIRLSRFGGQVYIDFKDPVRAKLSPADFYRNPKKKSNMQARNIMIDMLGSGGTSKLTNASLSYFIRSSKAQPNDNWNEQGKENTYADTDNAPSGVTLSLNPSQPRVGQKITLKATANNKKKISQINLFLDNKKVETCSQQQACVATLGSIDKGTHSYYAGTKSAGGNEILSKKKSFTVGNISTNNPLLINLKPKLQQEQNFLTTEVRNVQDARGDSLNFVYDWRVEENSLAEINMPFDVQVAPDSMSIKNYTSYQNNGLVKYYSEVPGWTKEGKRGGAFVFDGKDDYVKIPKMEDGNKLKELTVEAWIKHDQWSEPWAAIISKPFSKDSWRSPYTVFTLTRNGSKDNINFQITIGANKAVSIISRKQIPTDEWTYIVGTYDGNEMTLYINGEKDGSRRIGKDMVDPGETDIFIGKKNHEDTGAHLYKGALDEVKVLSKSISAAEIKQHYNGIYNKRGLNLTRNGEEWQVDVSVNNSKISTNAVATNAVVIENNRKYANSNSENVVTNSINEEQEVTKTDLLQNFPNPFTSSTTVPFDLKKDQKVTMKIYDVTGRLVETVFKEKQESAGHKSMTMNMDAMNLTSGVYFCQMTTGEGTYMMKMTYIK